MSSDVRMDPPLEAPPAVPGASTAPPAGDTAAPKPADNGSAGNGPGDNSCGDNGAAKSKGAPTGKSAASKPAAAAAPGGAAIPFEVPPEEPPRRFFDLRAMSSFGSSLVVHMALLILLGILTLSVPQKQELPILEVTQRDEEQITERLDEQLDPARTPSFTTSSPLAESTLSNSTPSVGGMQGGSDGPALDAEVMESADPAPVGLAGLDPAAIPGEAISMALGNDSPGEPSAIVDGYDQAFDRITQEILLMLAQNKVLLMWLFDESESMKDDQQEIRARIGKVYQELGLTSAVHSDALMNVVASYGAQFHVHTPKPTSDINGILRAIDAVPIDPSGKEMQCAALAALISNFGNYGAGAGRRQLAVILVSDESGDPASNQQYLEPTIMLARQANCRIYILGREAVFGYPYAHMRWVHPELKSVHWLPIDRGPETAFVEQLQTSGFEKRYDAYPSGFGPYEQIRMAYETGGIFFMLPSLETNLVRGEKRVYELQAMRPYLPDLRDRIKYLRDRDRSALRSVLWKVINDLNPYDTEKAKYIILRQHFSADPQAFAKQAQTELAKAEMYVRYLDEAEKALQSLRAQRDQEPSARWRANYDLVYAQVMAYKVRVYEYGAFLTEFMKNPPVVPVQKPPNLRLAHWDMRHRSKTITGDLTASTIAQSHDMFRKVIYEHPGTPWAGRAEWELKRGFGIELVPIYHGPPSPNPRPRTSTIQIPKL